MSSTKPQDQHKNTLIKVTVHDRHWVLSPEAVARQPAEPEESFWSNKKQKNKNKIKSQRKVNWWDWAREDNRQSREKKDCNKFMSSTTDPSSNWKSRAIYVFRFSKNEKRGLERGVDDSQDLQISRSPAASSERTTPTPQSPLRSGTRHARLTDSSQTVFVRFTPESAGKEGAWKQNGPLCVSPGSAVGTRQRGACWHRQRRVCFRPISCGSACGFLRTVWRGGEFL